MAQRGRAKKSFPEATLAEDFSHSMTRSYPRMRKGYS